jgi:hypothetical protein
MAVYNFDIKGVTAPVAGETPVTTITECYQYTGAVSWSPSHATFAESTTYTATITLTAKTGFFFDGVAANSFIVEGATATNPANSGVVTAIFPETGIAPVVVWSLAEFIDKTTFVGYSWVSGDGAIREPFNGWGRLFAVTSGSARRPIITSSGTATTHLLVVDETTNPSSPSLLSVHSNNSQQFSLMLAEPDIQLKSAENIYRIRVEGAVVTPTLSGTTVTGYTNATANVQLNLSGLTVVGGGADTDFHTSTSYTGPFSIYVEIPETTANASADTHLIRIQLREVASPASYFRFDKIEIVDYGPR